MDSNSDNISDYHILSNGLNATIIILHDERGKVRLLVTADGLDDERFWTH